MYHLEIYINAREAAQPYILRTKHEADAREKLIKRFNNWRNHPPKDSEEVVVPLPKTKNTRPQKSPKRSLDNNDDVFLSDEHNEDFVSPKRQRPPGSGHNEDYGFEHSDDEDYAVVVPTRPSPKLHRKSTGSYNGDNLGELNGNTEAFTTPLRQPTATPKTNSNKGGRKSTGSNGFNAASKTQYLSKISTPKANKQTEDFSAEEFPPTPLDRTKKSNGKGR